MTALFSQSLEEILYWERVTGRSVHIPYIVSECVEYLYKYGLDVEGIFRLPGRQSAIKDTIARFERGQKIKFEDENTDIHVVASVLKTFLRDLPESLIPCHLFQKFMNIALRFMDNVDEAVREVCVEELADSMKLIPKDSFVVLKYVCRFLREVGLHEPTNKMSMMSLGTVFGYNLMRHIDKENSQLFLCTADLGQNLVYMLINFYTQVFVLEYTDKGNLDHDVPTADLLRMSRIIDIPAFLPVNPSNYADLEGIFLTVDSTLNSDTGNDVLFRITDNHYSLDSNKTGSESEDYAHDNDNVLVRSCEFVNEKKIKTLPLTLKEHAGLGRSYSTPSSPCVDLNLPPVPPRRTKSKLNRNRFFSEKRTPDTKVDVDETSQNIMPESINCEDVLVALSQVKIDNIFSQESSCSISPSTPSPDSVTSLRVDPSHPLSLEMPSDGKVSPSISDIKNQITMLKEELTLQRDRYKTQVTALKAQLTDMKVKYERRIETMEVEYKSQVRELENKLSNEKQSCATAIADVARLESMIHKYHMLFGDLP